MTFARTLFYERYHGISKTLMQLVDFVILMRVLFYGASVEASFKHYLSNIILLGFGRSSACVYFGLTNTADLINA